MPQPSAPTDTYTLPDFAFGLAGPPVSWSRMFTSWSIVHGPGIIEWDTGELPRPVFYIETDIRQVAVEPGMAERHIGNFGPTVALGVFVYTAETESFHTWDDQDEIEISSAFSSMMPISFWVVQSGAKIPIAASPEIGVSSEGIVHDMSRKLREAAHHLGVI